MGIQALSLGWRARIQEHGNESKMLVIGIQDISLGLHDDQRRRAALQVFGDPPTLHRNDKCAQKNNKNNWYEMEEEKI